MAGRKLNRLRKYDYSQPGAYFITFCIQNRFYKPHRFGYIRNGEMVLNPLGQWADRHWQNIPNHYDGVVLDEYIIMPDHIHGIIWLGVGTGQCHVPTVYAIKSQNQPSWEIRTQSTSRYGQLSKIVRAYKNIVTKWARNHGIVDFQWQRSYYDVIVRDERSLHHICQYIRNNPGQLQPTRFPCIIHP